MIVLRKRGEYMQVDYAIGPHRLRGSLGTKSRDVALRLKNRLENALAEGPESGKWAELQKVLPASTFRQFADYSGVNKNRSATWDCLHNLYNTSIDQRTRMKTLKPGSRDRYLGISSNFHKFIENRNIELLENIKFSDIEAWKTERVKEIQSKKGRDGTSVEYEVAVVKSIFKMAIQHELIVKNPVKTNPVSSFNYETRGAQPFTQEELFKLRAIAGRDLLPFLVFRWTGLRCSDVADLGWKDVKFRQGEIEKRTQKQGKVVVIPMHCELREALEQAYKKFSPAPEEPVLKCVFWRKNLATYSLNTMCRELGKRAGLTRNCTPHCFRDTLAVDMLLRGATMYDVAKVLGDTVKVVEKHYTPFVSSLRERIKFLLDKNDEGLEAVRKTDKAG